MKNCIFFCVIFILMLATTANADFSKYVDKNSAIVGDRLNYTIYPEYTGSSLLTTAKVSDVMPAYTTYITGSANVSGSYSSSTKKITWTLGTNTAGTTGKTMVTPDTKTITASTDTYISQSNPTSNYGSLTYLYGQNATNAIKRILVYFAISGIDSSAQVTSANLKLYNTVNVGGQLINIHRLTRSYTEGGATWNKATSSITWTNPGGDYNSKVWGSFEATPVNTYVSAPITDLVQSWINLSIPSNYGLLLNPTGTTGQSTWNSRTATTNKSTLVINYNWPRYSTNTTISAGPLVICGQKNVTAIMTYNASGSLVVSPPPSLTTTVTGGVTATMISGPTPSYPQILNPGSSISVSYVYRVTAGTGQGTIKFSGMPSSVGTNDAFASATSNVVRVSPPLGYSVFVASSLPSFVSEIINNATLFDTNIIPSGIISSSAITEIPPSVKVEKTASPSEGSSGTSIDFTITVTNTGNVSLDPIRVVDVLPTGMTYLSDRRFFVGNLNLQSSVDYNPEGLAQAFSYSASASGTANTFNLYVDSSNEASKIIAGVYSNNNGNPGTLLSTGSLTNPTNGAWNVIPINPINITTGTTYWLAILGPVGFGTIRFRDVLSGYNSKGSSQTNLNSLPGTWSTGQSWPAGMASAYLTATPSGTVVGKNITWTNVGPLSSGSSTVLNLVATIDGTKLGTLINNINATGTPPTGNSVVFVTTGAVQALYPAVNITKTASPNQGSPGTNIDFGIRVTNTGNATLSAVRVVDVLPTGLTYVSNNGSQPLEGNLNLESYVDYDSEGWAQACNYSAIASGTANTFNLYVDSSNEASKVVVGVYTDNNGHPGTLLSTGSLTNPTNGAWNAIPISSISISAGSAYWLAILSPVGYGTIRFRDVNSGFYTEGHTQTNLNALPDTWSTGYQWPGYGMMSAYLTSPSSGAVVGKNITWTNVGPLNPGGFASIGLVAQVDGEKLGTLTNNINVTGMPPTGNSVAVSQTTSIVQALYPAVNITKTASPNQGAPGTNIDFGIRVINSGNVTLNTVRVVDVLPTGLTYVSNNKSGTANGKTITWTNVGPLSAGSSTSIGLVASIDGAKLGTLNNNINATGTPPTGYAVVFSNTSEVQALYPAFSITKSASPDQGSPGTDIDFGIKVTNTGNVTLNTIQVVDTLPTGLTYVSNNKSGSVNGKVITWSNVGPLLAGSSTSIDLVASIDGTNLGNLTNSINATGTPPTGNSVFSESIETVEALGNSNLSITKKANSKTACPGDEVNFIISVTNTGDIDLPNIRVVDYLPTMMVYESDNRSGVVMGNMTIWHNVGPLARNQSTYISLNTTVV